MTMTLPDCMMPDGADPCIGFLEIQNERDRLKTIILELVKALEKASVFYGDWGDKNDADTFWADHARAVIARANEESKP